MKCVCASVSKKRRNGRKHKHIRLHGGAYILGVADEKNTEKKIYSILAVIHLSLFIFQDLKEWRAKKKSRTICTQSRVFFLLSIRRKSLI